MIFDVIDFLMSNLVFRNIVAETRYIFWNAGLLLFVTLENVQCS